MQRLSELVVDGLPGMGGGGGEGAGTGGDVERKSCGVSRVRDPLCLQPLASTARGWKDE